MQANRKIEEVTQISVQDFYRNYVLPGKPIIIKDIAKSWYGFQAWNTDYFLNNYGDVEVSTIKVVDGKTAMGKNSGYKLERNTLGNCIKSQDQHSKGQIWSVATPIEDLKNMAEKDIIIPQYCLNGKFLRQRLFIAPDEYVTTLHQDLMENLYVSVRGKKKIMLFSPQTEMYRYPIYSGLPNASRIDPENPDYESFPKLRTAIPYSFTLNEGDALFIPALWWHHLRSCGQTITVSFWWSRGLMLPIVWAGSLYKRWRGI